MTGEGISGRMSPFSPRRRSDRPLRNLDTGRRRALLPEIGRIEAIRGEDEP